MVSPSGITPGFRLPRPIYRTPLYAYALRRRQGGTPRPRSPFMHFALDCIFQRKITFSPGDKSKLGRISRTIRGIWCRMSYEQRRPWIRMAERDAKMISRIFGGNSFVVSRVHGDSGGREQISKDRYDTTQRDYDGSVACPNPRGDIAGFEQDVNAIANNAAINWQRGRHKVSQKSMLTSNPELPFLEFHRRRYSTPERSTYPPESSVSGPDIPI